ADAERVDGDRLLLVRHPRARRRHAAAASRDEALAASRRPGRTEPIVRGLHARVVILAWKGRTHEPASSAGDAILRTILLPVWRTNHRITAELVGGLPLALWSASVPGVPHRTIRMIAAHLHNARCSWIRTLGR